MPKGSQVRAPGLHACHPQLRHGWHLPGGRRLSPACGWRKGRPCCSDPHRAPPGEWLGCERKESIGQSVDKHTPSTPGCVPWKGTGDAGVSETGPRPRGADAALRRAHAKTDTHQTQSEKEAPGRTQQTRPTAPLPRTARRLPAGSGPLHGAPPHPSHFRGVSTPPRLFLHPHPPPRPC